MSSVSWIATASGNWSTAADWSTGLVPGSADYVTISPSTSGETVTYSSGTTSILSLYVNNATFDITGGSLSVLGNVTIYSALNETAGTFSVGGSASSISGVITQSSSATLKVATGTLEVSGTGDSFAGKISGSGIYFYNGTDTLQSTSTLTVQNVEIGYATVTLAKSFTLTSNWSQFGGTLALGGNTLALSGTESFDGGVINGSGALNLSGTTEISGAAIQGTVTVTNTGTFEQTGYWYLGDSSGDATKFVNASGATFKIDSNTYLYSYTGATLSNAGTMAKYGGDTSVNEASTTSTGTVAIHAGDLDFVGGNNSFSGTISGAGTLELSSGSTSFGSGLTLSGGAILLDGATLTMGAAHTYAGDWQQSSGSLALGGFILTLTGNVGLTGGATTGAGTITDKGTSTISSYFLEGSSKLNNSGTLDQTGYLYIGYNTGDTASVTNEAAGIYDLTGSAEIYGTTGALFTNAGTLSHSGSTNTAYIEVSTTNTGTITVSTGALEFTGTSNSFGGTISGAGTLILDSGADSFNSGLSLSVGVLELAGATLTLGAALTYAGHWEESSGTLALGGNTLTISGTTSLTGGIVNGSGTLALAGGTIDNFAAEGAAKITNSGTLTQSGSWYVGYNSGDTAKLVNTGTVSIAGDFSIYGTSTDLITNSGTITKSGGSSTSAIEVSITSTGTIGANSGVLDLTGPTNSIAGKLSGSTTIELGGGTDTFQSGLTLSVAQMLLYGATLDLAASQTYAKIWNQYSGILALGGFTFTLSGSANFDGGTINGAGTVALSGTSELSSLALEGSAIIANTGTLEQTGSWYLGYNSTDTSQLNNEAGGTLKIDNGTSIYSDSGALLTNAGTIIKDVTNTSSEIETSVTDTGTITIKGGRLIFGGPTNSFSGTIGGVGTVEFLSGASTLASGITLSVATTYLDGATLNLGGSITYANIWTMDSGTLALGGNTLTLSGQDSFNGGATSGAGTIAATGTTTINAFNLEGSSSFSNSGTTTQSGSLYVGYNTGSTAMLDNLSGGTYRLVDNSSIYGGTAGTVSNSGTLAKALGSGTSYIEAAVINAGTINLNQGTLVFYDGVTGAGSINAAAGTSLVFDAGVAAGSVTLGTDALLEVSFSAGFDATLNGFAAGNIIDLSGLGYSTTETLGFNSTTDVLTVTNGTSHLAIQLAGTYTSSSFVLFSDNGLAAIGHT